MGTKERAKRKRKGGKCGLQHTPAVNEVSEEEVVGVGWFAADAEQLQQIPKLALENDKKAHQKKVV